MRTIERPTLIVVLRAEELETVTFHLPDEKKLYVDKRMLVARSEYFRNMLGTDTYKEGQTNQVDLTTDPQALGIKRTDTF